MASCAVIAGGSVSPLAGAGKGERGVGGDEGVGGAPKGVAFCWVIELVP